MNGLYVYSVGSCNQDFCRMQRFVLPVAGGDVALETIPYRDIEAIVKKVPLKEFDFKNPAAKKRFENTQWLRKQVLEHEAVAEALMQHTPPIVPFKFATVFRSRNRVQQSLKTHYCQIKELLEHFRGRSEWGIKLFSNTQRLTRKLIQEDQELRALSKKMKQDSAGRQYFLKKEQEAQVKEKAHMKQDKAASDLLRILSPLYEEQVLNQVMPGTLTDRKEDMIINAALLVSDEHRKQLSDKLKKWNQKYKGEGFQAELTGPWPPYNFAKL